MVEIDLTVGESVEYNASDLTEEKLMSARLTLDPSLEFYLNSNLSDIDKALVVGAGVGVASKILTSNGKDVTNIEPIESRFDILEINCPSATNIMKACDSSSGTGTMYYFNDNESGAKLNTNFGNASENVDVITVDSLGLDDLDILIVTANGKELDILEGAATTIADNTGIKVVITWVPDLMDDIDQAVTDLKALPFTSYKIIHWEDSDNSVSYRNQYTDEYPDDNLKIVQQAVVLME